MSPVRRALACLLGLVVFGCNSPSTTNTTQNLSTIGPDPVTSVLPVGDWGGDNIQLYVLNNGGGIFSFNCGNGGTTGAIVPDENMHFDATGTYTGFADPNDPDNPPVGTQDVIYHGDVTSTGDMIGLSVEFPNGDAPGGRAHGRPQRHVGSGANITDCE